MWICSSLFVVVIALCGCSFSPNSNEALSATAVFHRSVDSGEFGTIYDAAAKGFQATAPRETLIAFLTRVNRKMGKCGDAKVVFGGYQATTSGTFITLNSSRVCANGTLREQFVWLASDGKVALLRYNANNPLLLTDQFSN